MHVVVSGYVLQFYQAVWLAMVLSAWWLLSKLVPTIYVCGKCPPSCLLCVAFDVAVCTCSNPIVVTKSTDSTSPLGRQRFNYLFYIDFVGALSDPNCQNALRHLQVRFVVGKLTPRAVVKMWMAVLGTRL